MSPSAPPSAGAAWLRRSVLLLGMFALVPATASEAATPRRYELEQRKISDDKTRLRLYNRRTGRTVWTCTVADVEHVAWSKDGTALAIVDDRAGVWRNSWYFRLLYWRVGERVQVRDDLRPLKRFEGVIEMAWSPDNRRLLILGGHSMGDLMAGTGPLWCFDTRLDRSGLVSDDIIAAAEWVTPTTVRAWSREWVENAAGELVPKDSARTLDVRRFRTPDPKMNYPAGR